jgi:hypothetical protein
MPKLFITKLLLPFLLWLPAGFPPGPGIPPPDCSKIRLELQVQNSEPGLNNGTVQATVSGAEQPVYYIFYVASGQLLSKDVSLSKVEHISPGTYYCSVVDGKGCVRKSEFKIE